MPDFTNPWNVIVPQKLNFRELTRALRQSISAEEDAVHLYEAYADATDNSLAKEAFQDVADEEKVHIGEFQAILDDLLPNEEELLEGGAKEIEEMNDSIKAFIKRRRKAGAFKDPKKAIETAVANAERTGKPWYVNSTTDGIRVEPKPVKDIGIGTYAMYEALSDGTVKDLAKGRTKRSHIVQRLCVAALKDEVPAAMQNLIGQMEKKVGKDKFKAMFENPEKNVLGYRVQATLVNMINDLAHNTFQRLHSGFTVPKLSDGATSEFADLNDAQQFTFARKAVIKWGKDKYGVTVDRKQLIASERLSMLSQRIAKDLERKYKIASELVPYEIVFKPSPGEKKETWTRFYRDDRTARQNVKKVLDKEFSGEAVLISLKPAKVASRRIALGPKKTIELVDVLELSNQLGAVLKLNGKKVKLSIKNNDLGKKHAEFKGLYLVEVYPWENSVLVSNKPRMWNPSDSNTTQEIEKGRTQDVARLIPGREEITGVDVNLSLYGKTRSQAIKTVYNAIGRAGNGYYHDEGWNGVREVFKALEKAGITIVTQKTEYQHDRQISDMPVRKVWYVEIPFITKGMKEDKLSGRITASGAGSVEDPLESYDVVTVIG